ncbi:cyclic nucleotide-binding domain-containing protein [Sphingopyxis terrae]|uniref:cyclic nucleotide-binding domain-containing protein n=1 Tax=Sphingopyxis terrae TaxID=33052 RepID=UPI003F7E1F65
MIGVVSSTGRDANRIFQVAEGYVRLTGLHEDGSEALITIYVSGNCYAETALVSRRPYNHTSIAMVKSRINILHERDF